MNPQQPLQQQQQLEAAIAGLEAQRSLLGDALVDAALVAMRAQLAVLVATPSPPPTPTPAPAPSPLPAPAAAQALKLVSIVFIDMVGSTQLAARLDAEDTLELFSNALSGLAVVVQAHGGRVMRYTGDGLKAIFGADGVQEDDAERAVHCGLALLAAAAAHAQQLRAQQPGGDIAFQVRVGIHTGPVALGGGMEGVDTAVGSAVHIAARMEQAALPGTLRISHDTCRHVRGMFEMQAQPPLQVKGVAEPMTTYLVQRARPRAQRLGSRGIEGVATRMIGRDAELAALQQAHRRLCSASGLAALTVVAEAGIGKSRLRHEFEAWMARQPERLAIFSGRATPQTQGQPFGLLRDILATRLDIADDDDLATARAKLQQGIAPLFLHDDGPDLAEGHAHLLGHLIGIEWRDSGHLRGILDDARQIRQRALHAAAQWLRRTCASTGAPLLLQLEDLHWADDESLDFLDHLATVNRDVPMLVLAYSRGTLFERRPDRARSDGVHQRMDLGPLDAAGSRLLAGELLKKLPAVPDLLSALLTGGAEGNPFYMEELVKMLIDRGAIQTAGTDGTDGTDGGPWQLNAERLLATEVPATLTGVLQARLDGLPEPERVALQQASVIGPVFWERALTAIDAQAGLALPALVRRELALPRQPPAVDSAEAAEALHEYAFKHQVLHQVTYATVLKRMKRELHGRLAHWLAAQGGLRANDFLGVIAEHFEQAGDAANAAEFHARAAAHAKARFAHQAVLGHVQRALALLDPAPAPTAAAAQQLLHWRLLDLREGTLDLQGERAGQGADIAALEQLAEALDDDGRRAHAAYRRAVMALRMGDWPACEQAARQGAALAERAGASAGAGADTLRLLSSRLLALALSKRGELDAGRALAQTTLVQARALGLRAVESFCLNALAVIASMQSDPLAMLDCTRQDLAISRETGNRRSEAVSLSGVGCGWMDLGEYAQARQALENSLRLLRAHGDRVIESATLCSLSTVALGMGEVLQALALARQAVDTASAVQARDMQAIALSKLGRAELALGRAGDAAATYATCQELARSIAEPVQHDASAGLARAALAQGQLDAALTHVEPLLAHLAAGGTLDGAEEPRRIEFSCHQVLAAAGDARADAWLQRAHAQLQDTAATIQDGRLRQGFLDLIPTHREITAAWAARPVQPPVSGV